MWSTKRRYGRRFSWYRTKLIKLALSAIDVWSAGMIMLFFLTKKFPLSQSSDDVEALMEIAAIIGRRRMEKAATLHCKGESRMLVVCRTHASMV